MNIKPLGDRVLVLPAPAEEKVGGIIIPDTAKEKPLHGKVVATGNGTKDEEMFLKEGDEVLYGKYSGTELEYEGAKYFIMRGDVYNRMENYRQAVFDYTRYEVIEGKRQTPQFYYVREQAEVKAKLFKQALSDIDIAIYLAPDETSFKAEKASLQLRLNLISEAMQTAEQCVKEAPDYSDGYLILGLAQINSGKKEEGLANLDKAKNLGNSQATSLIEKYKK